MICTNSDVRATSMDPNEQQIEFWNGEGGRRWADHDAQFERTIGPLTAPLLARIDANAALHALDIGCGCGNQTLALARHLGPAARVTGIDISPGAKKAPGMHDWTRRRIGEARLAWLGLPSVMSALTRRLPS